jgi:hypothetical protein
MPVDRLEVRVSITKLLLALVIVIVPLSIAGLILTERSVKSLDNSTGNDFKTMATMYSNEVSQFMRERMADIGALAQDPSIVSTVVAGSTAAKAQPAEKGILNSNASHLLRQRKILDPRFLSIIVTDDSGNLMAASQQPAKLSYAQDPIWQAAYNNGQPAVKISDVLDDEFTKSSYVTISVPIKDPASGAPSGILSAAVNISDLLARFQTPTANGARIELVNDDGMIVSAPNANVFAHVKSQQFDAVRDSLGSPQGSQSGWVMADLSSGPWIVGFANTGLKAHFSNLGWLVTVSQEEHQAVAPIRSLVHFALIMVILALFMLTLLFVYYYLHRTQRFSHLEEEEVPIEKVRTATAR